MTGAEFEKLVREALDDIPEEFLKALQNIEVTVEDEPDERTARQLHLTRNDILLGLYKGVPLPKRSTSYGNVFPDKITIFKNSIERIHSSPEAIKKAVKNTVIHEIAHYFGFDDRYLRELGIG
ncbi:metallopeptidase family protein [Candidatus Auribacterota bacterium]